MSLGYGHTKYEHNICEINQVPTVYCLRSLISYEKPMLNGIDSKSKSAVGVYSKFTFWEFY